MCSRYMTMFILFWIVGLSEFIPNMNSLICYVYIDYISQSHLFVFKRIYITTDSLVLMIISVN